MVPPKIPPKPLNLGIDPFPYEWRGWTAKRMDCDPQGGNQENCHSLGEAEILENGQIIKGELIFFDKGSQKGVVDEGDTYFFLYPDGNLSEDFILTKSNFLPLGIEVLDLKKDFCHISEKREKTLQDYKEIICPVKIIVNSEKVEINPQTKSFLYRIPDYPLLREKLFQTQDRKEFKELQKTVEEYAEAEGVDPKKAVKIFFNELVERTYSRIIGAKEWSLQIQEEFDFLKEIAKISGNSLKGMYYILERDFRSEKESVRYNANEGYACYEVGLRQAEKYARLLGIDFSEEANSIAQVGRCKRNERIQKEILSDVLTLNSIDPKEREKLCLDSFLLESDVQIDRRLKKNGGRNSIKDRFFETILRLRKNIRELKKNAWELGVDPQSALRPVFQELAFVDSSATLLLVYQVHATEK